MTPSIQNHHDFDTSDTPESTVNALNCLFRLPNRKKRKNGRPGGSKRVGWKLRADGETPRRRMLPWIAGCPSSRHHHHFLSDGIWRHDEVDDDCDDDATDCSSDDEEQAATTDDNDDDSTPLLQLMEEPHSSVREGLLIDLDSNEQYLQEDWKAAVNSSNWGNILFDRDFVLSVSRLYATATTAAAATTTKNPKQQRRARFDDENIVSAVYEIPSRHSFTREERRLIWSDLAMICANARRNAKEWKFEGCDWRNAIEEHHFQRDFHGTLVHPAHWRAYPV